MSKEITLKTGKLIINPAPFEASSNLWNAVQAEVSNSSFSPDMLDKQESLMAILFKIGSGPSFNAALWPCLERCTFEGRKIEKKMFEPSEMRAQYYQIITPCVEENIGPFAESLFSVFAEKMAAIAAKVQPGEGQK